MSGDMPWKEIFEWSMRYQDQGTSNQPRVISDEERKWLEEALKSGIVDLGKRLQDINSNLAQGSGPDAAAQGSTLEEKEQLLDELAELVENLDLARDLSAIGGLPTLLALMGGPQPTLRWRAAEVAAACAQNHPEVQAAFMAGGVLPAVWPLLDDPSPLCQVKALLVVSCMVRGHAPALAWLQRRGGAGKLAGMAGSEDGRVQRKCLQVLQHVLQAAPAEGAALCRDGAPLVARLAELLSSGDGDIRTAALGVANQLAAGPEGLRCLQQGASLRLAAQALECRLDTLPEEEWAAAEEELAQARALLAALAAPAPAAAEAAQRAAAGGELTPETGSMQIMVVPQA